MNIDIFRHDDNWQDRRKVSMKKVILAAGIVILVSLFCLYKVGEDMMSMTRCGCR